MKRWKLISSTDGICFGETGDTFTNQSTSRKEALRELIEEFDCKEIIGFDFIYDCMYIKYRNRLLFIDLETY